jgi:uncharacterized protein YbjT (DUF2867 family)
VFGRGLNPINFVSARDVAGFVELAVSDEAIRGVVLDVAGPENLSMRRVVEVFGEVTDARGTVQSVPLPVLRAMSVLLRPFNRSMAGLMEAAATMDTRDMTVDASEVRGRYPSIRQTRLAEVVALDYGRANASPARSP